MATIFTYINDILYKKTGKALDRDGDDSQFTPYLIQRWLSMYSAANVRVLNATTNIIYKGLDKREQWYKLFMTTLPRSKYKRFRYIKKTSKDSRKNIDDLEAAIVLIAETKEISRREVRLYIEKYGLDVKSIRKCLKEGKNEKENHE